MNLDRYQNVVFVTIDSLRSDYLYICNKDADKEISPTLNKLAQSSIVFNQAYSQGPYTRAAFSAIFYSSYLSKVAKLDGGKMDKGKIKPKAGQNWVEILNNSGFKTAGMTTNPFTGRLLGYGKGFDYFEDRDQAYSLFIRKIWPKLDRKLKVVIINRIKRRYFPAGSMDSPYINALFKKWLLKEEPDKFFSWLHYMDVHTPYWNNTKPPKDFSSLKPGELEKLKDDYKKAIKHVDRSIKDLISFLKKKGVYEQTLIVITSDHGENFGEHQLLAHPGEYYEESIKVPLIFHNPSIKGKLIEKPVELTDIGPTILDLVKPGLSDQFSSDGVSLKGLIESNKKYPKKYVVGETFSPDVEDKKYLPSFYVRGKRYKLIVFPTLEREELYDLKEDQEEKHNIIDKKRDLASEMKKYFKKKISE